MYPDLSYLFHDLLGTQPDNWLSIFKMFGFMLAMAFLASAVVFYAELKRKAREGFYQPTRTQVVEGLPASWGEILSNAVVGLILAGKGGYAYQNFTAFKEDPAAIILSGKMHWLAALIGAAIMGGLAWWDAQRRRKKEPLSREVLVWPHDRINEMTVAAAVGGVLGAKLFDVFDNWESFLDDPVGTLASGGGLAFFGGLVLGFVAVVGYMWRHKIPFLPTADAVAPALVAGYGVGRIGCQLSGDGDWGIVNAAPKPGWMGFLPDWAWAYKYPHHVLNSAYTDPVASVPIPGCQWTHCMELAQPVYPTPLYEVLMMCVVFGILWALRRRMRVPGMLFFLYLVLIAVERFFIEKIRVNVVHEVLGLRLTQAEMISIALFLIGLVGMGWLWRKRSVVEKLSA
jgi:prolipoprotein diacylglyceryl transferase